LQIGFESKEQRGKGFGRPICTRQGNPKHDKQHKHHNGEPGLSPRKYFIQHTVAFMIIWIIKPNRFSIYIFGFFYPKRGPAGYGLVIGRYVLIFYHFIDLFQQFTYSAVFVGCSRDDRDAQFLLQRHQIYVNFFLFRFVHQVNAYNYPLRNFY
jgi:hypothetical protein